MRTRFAAERSIGVPAKVVYHCLADYREHHRPGGFLPPAFSDFELHAGGYGAGTQASWVVELGGRRRTLHALITEPRPGRTLVETATGVVTTFTVEPAGSGCVVRFESVFEEAGVTGLLLRVSVGRLLGPVYREELEMLETYAKAHTGPV